MIIPLENVHTSKTEGKDCESDISTFLARFKSEHVGKSVLLADEERFARKLEILKKAGSKGTHFLVDFDHTLTKYYLPSGERSLTSHMVVSRSRFFPEKCKQELKRLFEFFYPIERNPEISAAVKEEKMLDWWRQTDEQFVKATLTYDDVVKAAKKMPLPYRAHTHEMMDQLNKLGVSVTVVSGSITDIILECMRQEGLLWPNMVVLANKAIFADAPTQNAEAAPPSDAALEKHSSIATQAAADSAGGLVCRSGLQDASSRMVDFHDYKVMSINKAECGVDALQLCSGKASAIVGRSMASELQRAPGWARPDSAIEFVVAVGDSLDDAHMGRNFEFEPHLVSGDGGDGPRHADDRFLRVGFCGQDDDDDNELYERYRKVYDVVVIRDGGFEPLQSIIRFALGK